MLKKDHPRVVGESLVPECWNISAEMEGRAEKGIGAMCALGSSCPIDGSHMGVRGVVTCHVRVLSVGREPAERVEVSTVPGGWRMAKRQGDVPQPQTQRYMQNYFIFPNG